jgi:hypothetical protein
MLLLLASPLGDCQLDLDATLPDLIRMTAKPGSNRENDCGTVSRFRSFTMKENKEGTTSNC